MGERWLRELTLKVCGGPFEDKVPCLYPHHSPSLWLDSLVTGEQEL